MWTFREHQIEAFRQHQLQTFEDEMVDHLQKFAPRHWKVMGEQDGRRVIRLGIERARNYGFNNRGPVCYYIELMFMFGSYYDSDPQYPWASAVLNNSLLDQMARAEHLFASMNQYLRQVTGPDHQYLTLAMQRLTRYRSSDFVRSGLDLEDSLLENLAIIYPQKHEYLGETVLRSLIKRGYELAAKHGVATQGGIVLMVVLTLAVGHRFPEDPLHTWIGRRLQDARRPDPRDRIEELYSKSMLYLNRVLEN